MTDVTWSTFDWHVWGWEVTAARNIRIPSHFNGEREPTHTFLNVFGFHTALAMDLIQALNESKEFGL